MQTNTQFLGDANSRGNAEWLGYVANMGNACTKDEWNLSAHWIWILLI